MDTQQMMQQLLDNKQKAEANVKANLVLLTRMEAKIDANRKSDREKEKGMMNATQERLDANLKDLKE
jgi:hypothetical protein